MIKILNGFVWSFYYDMLPHNKTNRIKTLANWMNDPIYYNGIMNDMDRAYGTIETFIYFKLH